MLGDEYENLTSTELADPQTTLRWSAAAVGIVAVADGVRTKPSQSTLCHTMWQLGCMPSAAAAAIKYTLFCCRNARCLSGSSSQPVKLLCRCSWTAQNPRPSWLSVTSPHRPHWWTWLDCMVHQATMPVMMVVPAQFEQCSNYSYRTLLTETTE